MITVQEFLKIIFEKDGLQTSQKMMDFTVVVLAKFLQIMVRKRKGIV